MENIIIECREAEAQVNNNAGDWSTKIQEHVVVEEGDEINIRNVFIDTEATESEKIVIPFDIELQMANYKYLIDWTFLDQNHVEAYKDNGINPKSNIFPNREKCLKFAATEPTGVDIFAYMDDCKNGRPEGPQGQKFVSTGQAYILTEQPKNMTTDLVVEVFLAPKSSSADFGNCILQIKYVDPQGDDRERHVMVPLFQAGKGSQIVQPYILCKENTERTYSLFASGDSKSPLTLRNTVFQSELVETQNNKPTCLLKIGRDSITVPKGNYDPDDLTVLLNREMNKNKQPSPAYIDSPYMSLIISNEPNNSLFWGIEDVNAFPFKIASRDDPFSPGDVITNYYVGASKLELAYIPSSKQFSWNYMHMPYYDGPSEATAFYDLRTQVQVTKNAGIMWESLQAVNKTTGEPFDFWSNILGFELQGVNNIQAEVKYTYQNYEGADTLKPDIQNYENGKTVTGGFSGIDAGILKTSPTTDFESADIAPFFASPLDIPGATSKVSGANPTLRSATPTNGLPSTVTKTDPIIGLVSSLNHQDSYGYFLLEVQAKFRNEFIGKENNFNFIKSIISRFYSIDSYTSGNAQDSIVYIHKGEPMLLDSFNIRVLEPDKQLATNIGNDNSVYIQVIKPPKKPEN
jgi:hypothetical protein